MKLSSANINVMVKACRKAAKTLIRDFGEIEKLQVSLKGPGDFVTASDKKVEKILIDELQKARPKYSILSEEIGLIKNEEEFKWIIDPIDGTANFLHGIPHFAISIGLEHNNEIICGIIFTGGPKSTSKDKDLVLEEYKKFSSKLLIPVRKMGSASLDMAYVAAGRCDGFWQRNLMYWDIAAGIILVKEAGGFVTDFRGNNEYIENKTILAANSRINEEMIEILK